MKRRSLFSRTACVIATWIGRPIAFAMAVLSIVIWAATGPLLDYSEFWQLTINTGTTIVTFLIVFLIQNSQNRDSESLHVKIDELIRAMKEADDTLMGLDDLHEDDLHRMRKRYEHLATMARDAAARRGTAPAHHEQALT